MADRFPFNKAFHWDVLDGKPVPLKRVLRDLWAAACVFDDVDPASMFVVFSDDNPFLDEYNRAMALAMA